MMNFKTIVQNGGHSFGNSAQILREHFLDSSLPYDMLDNSVEESTNGSHSSRSETSQTWFGPKNKRPRVDIPNGLLSDVNEITNVFARLGLEDPNKSPPTEPFKGQRCTYCGIKKANCLIQCRACSKWFCNGGQNTSGSHAITHLVFAKHREVCRTPHKSNVKCQSCGSRNVFLLGSIESSKIPEKRILLCRQPCSFKRHYQNIELDHEKWNPLIEDRVFVSWLVKVPSMKEHSTARKVTDQQIRELEKPSKDKKDPVFQYLNELGVQRSKKYADGEEYRDIFLSLVKLEADYQTQLKEKVEVKWEEGVNKILGFFTIPQTDQFIKYGEDLKLIYVGKDSPWSGFAYVNKPPTPYDQEIGIVMKDKRDVPTDRTNFIVEFFWEMISFDRIKNALRKFSKNDSAVSHHIFQKILGNQIKEESDEWTAVSRPKASRLSGIRNRSGSYKANTQKAKAISNFVKNFSLPNDLSAPNLPKLNEWQNNAVRHSLENTLTLIQGPPGTGKTVTSATIVYHLVKRVNRPVLVCAPSNVAVDHLTEKIHKTGLNVVRVCAKTREEIETSVLHLSLHKLVLKHNTELKELKARERKEGFLSNSDDKRFNKLKHMCESEILKDADVICCTCIAAGDRRLKRFKFHSILIDESTQATEPECIVPIVLGAKQLILVGDHKQLGPIVKCQKAGRDGYSQSLFERLVLIGESPVLLKIQYRMHPCLSAFPSQQFYDNELKDGVSSRDRKLTNLASLWPKREKPMFFYCCDGWEEFAGSGTSYLNRKEVSIVHKILIYFIKRGIKAEQIGVITPYEGQRSYMVDYLQYKSKGSSKAIFFKQMEVASVDAFQGREKDLIIFTCVRSNSHQGIGFLKDPRRLNVAITRARYGLIVLGNPKVLSKVPLWNDLLTFYKSNNVLVEGPLNKLVPSHSF